MMEVVVTTGARGQLCPHPGGGVSQHPQMYLTSYARAHGMRNGHQVLHGDQTRGEGQGSPCSPRPGQSC